MIHVYNIYIYIPAPPVGLTSNYAGRFRDFKTHRVGLFSCEKKWLAERALRVYARTIRYNSTRNEETAELYYRGKQRRHAS